MKSYTKAQLKGMTLVELRKICKEHKIAGCSKKGVKKADVVELVFEESKGSKPKPKAPVKKPKASPKAKPVKKPEASKKTPASLPAKGSKAAEKRFLKEKIQQAFDDERTLNSLTTRQLGELVLEQFGRRYLKPDEFKSYVMEILIASKAAASAPVKAKKPKVTLKAKPAPKPKAKKPVKRKAATPKKKATPKVKREAASPKKKAAPKAKTLNGSLKELTKKYGTDVVAYVDKLLASDSEYPRDKVEAHLDSQMAEAWKEFSKLIKALLRDSSTILLSWPPNLTAANAANKAKSSEIVKVAAKVFAMQDDVFNKYYPEAVEEYSREELEAMSVKELKALCKSKNVVCPPKLKKSEIIELVFEDSSEESEPEDIVVIEEVTDDGEEAASPDLVCGSSKTSRTCPMKKICDASTGMCLTRTAYKRMSKKAREDRWGNDYLFHDNELVGRRKDVEKHLRKWGVISEDTEVYEPVEEPKPKASPKAKAKRKPTPKAKKPKASPKAKAKRKPTPKAKKPKAAKARAAKLKTKASDIREFKRAVMNLDRDVARLRAEVVEMTKSGYEDEDIQEHIELRKQEILQVQNELQNRYSDIPEARDLYDTISRAFDDIGIDVLEDVEFEPETEFESEVEEPDVEDVPLSALAQCYDEGQSCNDDQVCSSAGDCIPRKIVEDQVPYLKLDTGKRIYGALPLLINLKREKKFEGTIVEPGKKPPSGKKGLDTVSEKLTKAEADKLAKSYKLKAARVKTVEELFAGCIDSLRG